MLNVQTTKQTWSQHLRNLHNIFLRFTSIIKCIANQIMENRDFPTLCIILPISESFKYSVLVKHNQEIIRILTASMTNQ